MKKNLLILISAALILANGTLLLTAETPGWDHASLLAGGARQEITPPEGTPLAGFGRRRGKPSLGAHDPLYARAVVLKKGPETFAFVSADLVLIDEELREAALKKINETEKLESRQFLLTATHTHSGSGAIGGRFWERFIMGKFRKDVFKITVDGIAKAVTDAMADLRPAAAEHGQIKINELIENRIHEKADVPHTLKVLRFKPERAGAQKAFATIVFMAAHPTFLPSSNMLFSADFPGELAKNIESENSGSVAVFINGAAGDLRPKMDGFEDKFEKSSAYGFAVAEKIDAVDFIPANLSGPWSAVIHRQKLPRTQIQVSFLKIPSLLGNRVFPRKSYFQGLRAGPFFFFGFPGELASETGLAIETQARAFGFEPHIAGYANDYIGYVIPRRFYRDRENYESRASFYGPQMDWFVQDQARKIILELLRPEERKEFQNPGTLFREKNLPVLAANGDAYHLGFEEGRLLKNEIRQGTDDIYKYLRSELPVPVINRLLIRYALGRAWKKMEPFVSYEEYLQMKGLADGSGISMKAIKHIHALPEVYPTWCANGAYWGQATSGGRLIAIRNLDWNRKIGIHRHAAVKILTTPGKKTYANIGYYGFTGVLSGLNENGISVGQIGAVSSEESMEGVPMPFLLKRILQNSDSLEDALEVFGKSDLTRGYNYILADAVRKKAVAVEATQKRFAVFWDNDPKEKSCSYGFPLEDAIFRGDPAMDAAIRDLQTASGGDPKKPGLEFPAGSAYEIRYKKHGELIQAHYGKIDPETAKKIALEISPGSNIQSVIYAFPDFYVANAKDDLRATETEYVKFNFEEMREKLERRSSGAQEHR